MKFGFNMLLFLLSLVGVFSSDCQVSTDTYVTNMHYVHPKSMEDCWVDISLNASERLSCRSIDEYASNSILDSNARMVFLPGIHNLTRNYTLINKIEVSMTGCTLKPNESELVLYRGDINIQTSVKFTLSHLSISSYSSFAVLIKGVLGVTIENVTITGSALIIQCLRCSTVKVSNVNFIGSVLVIAWPEYEQSARYIFAYNSVVIKDSIFHLAPIGNGISCCNVKSLLVENISVSNLLPQVSGIAPPESRLVTYCKYFPWGLTELEICDLITTGINTVSIHNSTIKRISSTGLCVYVPLNANVLLNKTVISGHTKGGAMFTYGDNGVNLIILNTTICNNSNTFSGPTMASALSVYTVNVDNAHSHIIPKLTIVSSHFIGNAHLVSRPTSTVCITSHVRATIKDSEFIDNYGSAITGYTTYLDHVLVIFYGNIVFRNNTSHRGGAIHLFKSRIGLTKGVNISLQHNFAKDVGGAIYVHSTNWLSSYYEVENGNYGDCFFKLIDCNNQYYPEGFFTVLFDNNSAQNGGEHIFGASLLSNCNVCPFTGLSSSVLVPFFTFHRPEKLSFSPLSSYPSRICVCEQFSNPNFFCSNASLTFLSRSVYPGESFTLKAVLVGAEFGTGTGVVYAQFLSPSNSQLYPPYQYSQRVKNFKECTQLYFTVYSSESHEVLVLTASDETVLNYGDQEKLTKLCHDYDYEFSVVPAGLLTTPVYINLTLLPCPHGFHLTGSPPGCDCIPVFAKFGIFCNFTKAIGYIYRNDTIWVDVLDEHKIIMQRRCPFDYCLAQLTGVDLRHPDTQYAMNHAGTLCGGCRKRFSLALGTNMCLPCESNRFLGLLVFFASAGILLVVFIKILNMTVSQGTINGLVFYANIVWGYQAVFFPKTDLNNNKWFLLMKVFIAWLNLDFGIETCFTVGLTGYAKTWLQFVFPHYIWCIAGLMIFSAHNSKAMTKIFGNNCIQVLATLFLLSYAKLLRTVITIMVPAVLYVYPPKSEEWKEFHIVWAFDGNLLYCGNPHGFIFVAALLTLICVWLPYTAFLLYFKTVMKASSHKYLRWMNRIVPVFEAYFGPLKITNYYWVGLLLLVRGILLIILTLMYTSIPSACLLSLVIMITLLLAFLAYNGRVYKNKLLTALECFSLVNLQVLGVSTLFIDFEIGYASKDVAATVSLTIAFVQFIGIVCFHVHQILIKKLTNKCCHAQHDAINLTTETDSQYTLMERESMNDLVKRDLTHLQYLEDYAENADSKRLKQKL